MASAVSKEWKQLNELLKSADEEKCRLLLAEEFNGRRRPVYLMRIHSRLNYVRAHKERELLKSQKMI